ncbi:MAG: CAP domain-containing protein [Deltaproteobacteria bacterium]|nr:MAG: CAP domain-containing protein [Deltaproteobacteria bacterium]
MVGDRPIVMLALLGALTIQGCPPHEARGGSGVVRAGTVHASSADAGLERAAHELVNRHRRARGLAPLALDPRITQQARLHSLAMADGRTSFGHDGFPDRVDALRRVMTCQRSAENVASNKGHRDPAAEAVRGWLASRPHRENIEGPYGLTGVGVARSAAGEVFFTQLFIGR